MGPLTIWKVVIIFSSIILIAVACNGRLGGHFNWNTEKGGVGASKKEIPYQVKLVTTQIAATGEPTLVCSAVIYNMDVAIAPASCFNFYEGRDVKILSGDDNNGVNHGVETIKLHPQFVPLQDYTFAYDNYNIAVVKVSPPFQFDPTTQPIKIVDSEPKISEKGVTSGWGGVFENEKHGEHSIFGNKAVGHHLRKANITVIDRKVCDKEYASYKEEEDIEVNKYSLCVSYAHDEENHRSSCIEENGAPFVIQGKLVGLQRPDRSCVKFGIPGLYVNLVEFKDWIEETAKSLSS